MREESIITSETTKKIPPQILFPDEILDTMNFEEKEDDEIKIPHTKFEDEFSKEIWRSTYKYHEDETIDDTLKRVAYFVASAEKNDDEITLWQNRFYEMLSNFSVVPGGRILANAGTEFKGTTLFNCFTSPRKNYDIDSIDGILEDVLNQCKTLKSEGGWGNNFSFIRPRGSFIHGIGVESPGAVKYMEIYDKTSDIITSGSGKKSANKKAKGKIRKGAMMSVLDCTHPDVEEFIRAKQIPGKLTKFNISVNCTDEFMRKLLRIREIDELIRKCDIKSEKRIADLKLEREENDKWYLRFPVTTFKQYKEEWDGDLKEWEEKGYPVQVYKTISVTGLWNMIMESNFERAEPGVLYLDRARYFDPTGYAQKICTTNPCAEQQMPSGSCCNLSSLNLTQFITHDKKIDMNKIKKYVHYAVRFLDNINDLSNVPLKEYADSMKEKRRIGIGVMGWGSVLYMLKIKFASSEASKLREEIMNTIAREAYIASINLAEEKGMFDHCDPEKHAETPFVRMLDLPKTHMKKLFKTGIRNSSILSCQPTGNSSVFANVVSGGIEPIFMPEYTRTVIVNEMPNEIAKITPKWYEGEWHETKLFKFEKEGDEEILKGNYKGITYKIDKNRGLTKEVICQDYGVRWLKERGQWEPDADWAMTTTNLDVKDHVEDLKGFAKWVDSSISKTVNVPYEYPFEDFKNIYIDAYSSGYIKGITTYRAGTMTSVLSAKEEKDAAPEDEEIILEDFEVPTKAPAVVSTIRAEGKKWYLTTIMDEDQRRPIAFFCNTNHHEKSPQTLDAVDRLLNLAEKKGIPSKWIEDTANKMGSDNNSTKIARCISLNLRHGVLIRNVVGVLNDIEDVFVGSFLFQIRKHLMSWIKDGEPVTNTNGGATCIECGGAMRYESGCSVCSECGNSKCG
jgi:ribonucleoside-diphosphate reductase alpha chain